MKKSITLVPNNTPAVATQAWPTQRKIRELAENLDHFSEYWDELCGAEVLLENMDAARIPERDFENAKHTIERYAKRGYKERIKELQGEWNKVNPRHWYAEDDDEQPNVAAVSSLLANFVGSFPTSNIPSPKVFMRQMLEDVMDLEPSFPVLESACRKLRKSQKFMPSISEVVEAIEIEQGEWNKRSGALYFLADEPAARIELLATAVKAREAARIEAERREAEWREAEQKRQKERDAENHRRLEILAARTMPIRVGDRVRDPTFGHGTVKEIDYETDHAGPPANRAYNYYFVVFDEEGEGHPRCIAGPFGPTGANYCHVVFAEDRPQRSGGLFFLERLAACEESETDDAARGGE